MSARRRGPRHVIAWGIVVVGLVGLAVLHGTFLVNFLPTHCASPSTNKHYRFPLGNDPFHLIPCTDASLPPPLDDPNPLRTWEARFDPNPSHWSWGPPKLNNDFTTQHKYSDRGIYLCGYLDVPLDYLNKSDTRIARLAVTKYQVSGLARLDRNGPASTSGSKSSRTIILEPGGPGESGTSYVWEAAEQVTERFSKGQFDVLGWDPRGVNISLPAMACFPDDSLRDRYSLLMNKHREESNPMEQLQTVDAMNDAKFNSCQQLLGDFGRFISTTSVARDLEEIRKALGEDEVSGYFISYGTGIAQTFANMFPHSVGRMILDGTEYFKDHRLLGGFALTSVDNSTDIWRDGFLSECVNAGPKWCALAQPYDGDNGPATLKQLEARMARLFESLKVRPAVAYTPERGPSLVTYSTLVSALYPIMYDPRAWPAAAQMLRDLEKGNSTLAAIHLDRGWNYSPTHPLPNNRPSTGELPYSVVCADSYDAPLPEDGLHWWDQLWESLTNSSWVGGHSRFLTVFPCQNYRKYWSRPAELYRGDLNHTLSNPILLISTTHDPATPLRNGKRLLADMGHNARLIIHHGYGHTSRWDRSACTDDLGKAYMLHGTLPWQAETNCFANQKPYVNSESV